MLRVVMIEGRPGATDAYTASDVAQSLPAAVLEDSGAECVGLLITVEANPVRIALGGGTPTQGGSPSHGHALNPDDVYRIYGNQLASTFKYINANAGNNGILQITPFYT